MKPLDPITAKMFPTVARHDRRTPHLIAAADMLQRHAVGFCKGEQLPYRARVGETAMMFFKDGKHFWYLLCNHEFKAIFHATE